MAASIQGATTRRYRRFPVLSYRKNARRLAMPRYYFHVRRGQLTVLDQDGIELADTVETELEAAQRVRRASLGREHARPAREDNRC